MGKDALLFDAEVKNCEAELADLAEKWVEANEEGPLGEHAAQLLIKEARTLRIKMLKLFFNRISQLEDENDPSNEQEIEDLEFYVEEFITRMRDFIIIVKDEIEEIE